MSLADINQYNPNIQFGHPPPPPPTGEPPRAKKQTRITRACDFCHSRSTKCKQNPIKGEPCLVCLDFSKPCTYNRPIKKRGIPGKTYKPPSIGSIQPDHHGIPSRDGESDARMLLELTNGAQVTGLPHIDDSGAIPGKWRGMILANEGTIKDLMEVYVEVLHPQYPLFHVPSLRSRLESRDYLSDVMFFAEVMVTCALAATKATDQILVAGKWPSNHFNLPHRTLSEAAHDVLPTASSALKDLPWLRTCALAALYGLHTGQKDMFYEYLGRYLAVVSMEGLDDEANWPKNVDVIDVELRRRLFWAMYSVDVFSSLIWGSRIRSREICSKVSYPSEVDDEFITPMGIQPHESPVPFFTTETAHDSSCWLHGWNFHTDLHRMMERSANTLSTQQEASRGDGLPFGQSATRLNTSDEAMETVRSLHASLSSQFRSWESSHVQTDPNLLRSELQSVRIVFGIELLHVLLVNGVGTTLDAKLTAVQSMLETFTQLPVNFLKAICTPFVYHFAGIAGIIHSILEQPMPRTSLTMVIEQIQLLAGIIQTIESGNSEEVSISTQLFDKTKMIADYLNHVDATTQNSHEKPSAVSPEASNIDPNLQPGMDLLGAHDSLDHDDGVEAPSSSNNPELGSKQQAYVQLPPTLVEFWPWALNLSHGFGKSI